MERNRNKRERRGKNDDDDNDDDVFRQNSVYEAIRIGLFM